MKISTKKSTALLSHARHAEPGFPHYRQFGLRWARRCLSLVCVGATGAGAASFTVTNTADSGAGTLRGLLASVTDGDTISFSVPGPATISLVTGELLVSNSVAILGPGATNLAIDGNLLSRVFHIAPSTTVMVAGLTISGGSVTGAYPVGAGGGIYNDHATLILSNCTVTGNSATAGGGIANDGVSGTARLEAVNSSIVGNSGGSGGGILNDGESGGNAAVTAIKCTVSANAAASGGGIYNDGAHAGAVTVQAITTTLSSNAASSSGGGIFNDASQGNAVLLANACTLSGNSAGQFGGGIFNLGNSGSAKLEIGDTILQAGVSGQNVYNLGGAVTSHGYNLCSDYCAGLLLANGDQLFTNPKLGSLQNNGGPTPTHALLSGSPAIDQGKRDAIPALAFNTDQRGSPRPIDIPNVPTAPGGDGSDIGGFEAQASAGPAPPLLTGAQILANGGIQFDFTNAPGAAFTVLSTTNIALPSSAWTVLGTPTEISRGLFQVTDPQASNHAAGFYRVRSP